MIKFDIKKLRVETYWVKSLTTALGGAIRIVDEDVSTDEHEVYHRLPVPLAVVRRFKTRHKTMKYIRPCLVAVAYYDDRAIALERHPAGCMGVRFEKKTFEDQVKPVMERWVPALEHNIEKKIRPLIEDTKKDWYFDGRYVFSFEKSVDEAVRTGEFLSQDGRFRCVEVDAVGLHQLDDGSKLDVADRTCMAYVAANNQYAVSPPIWKDATAVGQAKIKGAKKDRSDGTREFSFDRVDGQCAVNVSFALKAAKELSSEFGFEATEPLNLPSLMIRLNTVNLPKVASEVKDTFDSGLKFTHALAWLLGFARRCECLDTYASIRSLLKYLTANGLYFKDVFDPKNIFKDGHDIESVPMLSKKEALHNADSLSIQERLEIIKQASMQRNRARTSCNVVGGVMFDDEPEAA